MNLWLVEVDYPGETRYLGKPNVYYTKKSAIAHARRKIPLAYRWRPVKFIREDGSKQTTKAVSRQESHDVDESRTDQ